MTHYGEQRDRELNKWIEDHSRTFTPGEIVLLTCVWETAWDRAMTFAAADGFFREIGDD